MALPLVVRASVGTTTNPDHRQRLIEHQAAGRSKYSLPRPTSELPPHSAPTTAAHHRQEALPMSDGEAGFTTTLLAQKLLGEQRKFAMPSKPTPIKSPLKPLRDFII